MRINLGSNENGKGEGKSHWRGIEQVGMRGVTVQAKERSMGRFVQWGTAFLIGIGVIVGVFLGIYGFREVQRSMVAKQLMRKIERVEFHTDGVLSVNWVKGYLGVKEGQTMMEVDIYELKERLEKIRQVKYAVVERVFPDVLVIKLKEYKPLVRMVVRNLSVKGGKECLFVSKEGRVFRGVGYKGIKMERMPYVKGVGLKKSEKGYYEDLKEVPMMAELMELAKREHMDLYRDWRVIELGDLRGGKAVIGGGVVVEGERVGVVKFRLGDYKEQMGRLAYIVKYLEGEGIEKVARIDLTVGGEGGVGEQVAVKLM